MDGTTSLPTTYQKICNAGRLQNELNFKYSSITGGIEEATLYRMPALT